MECETLEQRFKRVLTSLLSIVENSYGDSYTSLECSDITIEKMKRLIKQELENFRSE